MQQSQLILPIYPPIYQNIVLCVLPGDSHPGTGYILSLAQSALNLYMLTQVFGAGDTAADGRYGSQCSECIYDRI